MKQKVFGIGFHKTGTTSLGKALEILNYKHCHGAGLIREKMGSQEFLRHLYAKNFKEIIRFAEDFDSLNDNPWYKLYRELDEAYVNSKFILTVRDEKEWLHSAIQYFKSTSNPIRSWIYGKASIVGNEALYLETYRNHNLEVKTYFAQRPKDLLILNLEELNKWDRLCDFLDCEKPSIEFPHLNKGRLS